MNWKIKKQVLSFLVKTRSLKEYDQLTPHRVAYKAVQLIENVIEGNNPPIITLTNEIQNNEDFVCEEQKLYDPEYITQGQLDKLNKQN